MTSTATNDDTRKQKRVKLTEDLERFSYFYDTLLYPHLTEAQKNELEETATKLCTHGKGISACDESAGTIGKRFEAVHVENTVENRQMYRQMLFETDGVNEYLSGIILDPETLYQRSTNDGRAFPEVLMRNGIVPGVKVHLKVYTLPGTNGDTVMQGLDSLAMRAREYYKAGARFAKWRSPLTIQVQNTASTQKDGSKLPLDSLITNPSDLAIQANMKDLARYALICQSEGLMPIVEPDISIVGTHTLDQAVKINIKVQSTLFKALVDHGVFLPGCTLKSNMIHPGKDCTIRSYSVHEIASANIFVLQQSFPVAMKGTNYLSGGQTLKQASARLAAINKMASHPSMACPWNLSFSWSAAIQLPLLELCKTSLQNTNSGKDNILQQVLPHMAKLYKKELLVASLAAKGIWHEDVKESDGHHSVSE